MRYLILVLVLSTNAQAQSWDQQQYDNAYNRPNPYLIQQPQQRQQRCTQRPVYNPYTGQIDRVETECDR